MLLRKISWKLCAALALLTASQGGRLLADDATDGKTIQASAVNVAFVESMIEDALQNGTVSGEERQLILNQAKRRLDAAGFAAVEARLANIPAPLVTRGETTDDAAAPAPQTAFGAAMEKGMCCDDAGCGGLFDNYYVFAGIDGWSGPADDDAANNFGPRIGFNMGAPIDECRGIGGQFGMSYAAYNFHGRDNGANLSLFEGASIEEQIFLTVGAFKRCNMCLDCPDRISWGIVYDHMITDNFGEHSWEFGIGQVRGQIGYALDCCNEIGATLMLHTNDVEKSTSGGSPPVSALDQASLYYRHHFCWGADTMLYAGVAEEPGDFLIGMRNEIPLSERCSFYGNAQYILPSTSGGDDGSRNMYAEEFWNVSVGFAYYPNCNAVSKSVCGRRWMPLLPVADNGSFAVDIAPDQL
jgi:hypothetical protein